MNKIYLIILSFLSFIVVANAQTYTLDQCKDSVIQNNVKIKNKQLDVEASKEVKKAAFTRYFPQVSASAYAYKFTDPLFNFEVPGGNLPVYDGNPANLLTATQFAYFPGMSMSLIENGTIGMATATQPVYAGGRIKKGNELANLGIEVNELQFESVKKEILLETEEKYWQLISLNEKKKTLENYMILLDTLHQNVSIAVQAGMITQNDLLKVELQQNELQMNHSKLSNGIKLAKMAFCQFIGIEYNENLVFYEDVEISKNPEQYYVDHIEALKNREEYMMLQRSSDAEKYKTKLQRGEYLPQAAVGAGALYLDIMDPKNGDFGMVYGTVSIPISGWWEGKHKMKERRIREEQNINMVNNTNEQLMLQMQQAYNMLEEAHTQVQLAKVSVKSAEENLRINQNNYNAGVINVSDMLEAQAQLQQSRDYQIEASTQFRIAKMNYLKVTGR